jgi:hypothetical protein
LRLRRGRGDDAPVRPELAKLSLEEQGYVLGAALARSKPAEIAARLGGDSGARCAAALEALAGESRAGRAAALAELIAVCRNPVPAHLAEASPAWIRARLAAQTTLTIRAVLAALPSEVLARVRPVALSILRERAEEEALSGPPPCGTKGAAELCRAVFGSDGP